MNQGHPGSRKCGVASLTAMPQLRGIRRDQFGEVITIFFVVDDYRFARKFEMGGKCSRHYLTFGAHVIRGHPFP